MKRIHSITLKNFKVFQDADPIVLDNRNLLLYGANGSGKSSLYWALYTFLQSSEKTTDQVKKYFDRTNDEHLVNVHVPANPASIMLTFKDTTDGAVPEPPIQITDAKHETAIADIKKACKSSDFITYRVLFRFYQFSNRDEIDLWPVFEREILPYCWTTLLPNMDTAWRDLLIGNPQADAQQKKARGKVAGAIYDEYVRKIKTFSNALVDVLDTVSKAGQKFYNDHFRKTDAPALTFTISLTREPDYDRDEHKLVVPKIGMTVTYGTIPVPRPQSFLNEALLTQMALSIRFGATKALLQDSPIKLMILDDLLISLDMSNRMQVIEILLSDADFQDYQKIIMTHDRGFFREIRRAIGNQHVKWSFLEVNRHDNESPRLRTVKEDMEQAEDYLADHKLDECAAALRKVAESNIKRFIEKKLGIVFASGKFHSLAENLRTARRKLEETALHKLRGFLRHEGFDDAMIDMTIPLNPADWQARDILDAPATGKLNMRGNDLRALLKEIRKSDKGALEVLAQIDEVRARILNPGAHAGAEPLYEGEVRNAVELLRKLQAIVETETLPV